MNNLLERKYSDLLARILDSAHKKNYSGYSKFDALNSPLFHFLSFRNQWVRCFWTQIVKECPVNIRPFFGVKKSRNPKGIALFARAYFFLYKKIGKKQFLDEGLSLLQWLLNHPSPNQRNLCWGYNFFWQNIPPFFQDKDRPNCVVTVFVGEALLHAYNLTQDKIYLEASISVSKFLTEDLPVLSESKEERAVAYICGKVNSVVLNNQVLCGAFFAKLWEVTQEASLLDIATRQLNYTFKRKTDYHAWYYAEPKERSPVRHDNYHTGGILDGFLEYFEATQDDRFMSGYWNGLEFYRKNLFEEDGAPRWMSDKKYPFDIHGAAQGIITFLKAARHKKEYFKEAEKILDWTFKNLYREKTQDFAYRKGRFLKWNYTLMRWCNAWMARALGEII